MQKTITPIDNTVYVEREYHSNKIEETVESSMKAQKDWSNLAVSERVKLLKASGQWKDSNSPIGLPKTKPLE